MVISWIALGCIAAEDAGPTSFSRAPKEPAEAVVPTASTQRDGPWGESSFPDRQTVAALMPHLPAQASSVAIKPRRLLVFTPASDRAHAAVGAYGAAALWLMGQSNRIYQTTVVSDPEMLREEALKAFDAVVLNNTFGDGFGTGAEGEKRAAALLEFVRNGKGLAGIHGAVVVPNNDQPPDDPVESQYRLMLGCAFEKPACMAEAPLLKVEDPLNPICAAFHGNGRFALPFKDEIVQLKAPYSRHLLRVLVSAEMDTVPHQGSRADHDYPLVWIKPFDQGRVFFFALGHSPATFNDPVMLRVLQDGIQYVLGDLPANDTPE
jgi:uncharacterized protein